MGISKTLICFRNAPRDRSARIICWFGFGIVYRIEESSAESPRARRRTDHTLHDHQVRLAALLLQVARSLGDHKTIGRLRGPDDRCRLQFWIALCMEGESGSGSACCRTRKIEVCSATAGGERRRPGHGRSSAVEGREFGVEFLLSACCCGVLSDTGDCRRGVGSAEIYIALLRLHIQTTRIYSGSASCLAILNGGISLASGGQLLRPTPCRNGQTAIKQSTVLSQSMAKTTALQMFRLRFGVSRQPQWDLGACVPPAWSFCWWYR